MGIIKIIINHLISRGMKKQWFWESKYFTKWAMFLFLSLHSMTYLIWRWMRGKIKCHYQISKFWHFVQQVLFYFFWQFKNDIINSKSIKVLWYLSYVKWRIFKHDFPYLEIAFVKKRNLFRNIKYRKVRISNIKYLMKTI